MIYLDNSSTTRVDDRVVEAMLPYFTKMYGNPGTLYGFGKDAMAAVEEARQSVADFIGADAGHIIFTAGGTEANNLVFNSVRAAIEKSEHQNVNIVCSIIEHDSVKKAARRLEFEFPKYEYDSSDHKYVSVTFVNTDSSGVIKPESIESAIEPNTVLVSVMYVNNETGAKNPVEAIGRICADHGVLFHTDCVQAAGCEEIDVKKINCDFLTLSSHKIHGPKGVGALYVRDKRKVTPLIVGGSAQEYGLRAGTENVPGIVGFGKACSLISPDDCTQVSAMKQLFYGTLISKLAESKLDGIVKVNGPSVVVPGKILNLCFSGIDGETLLLLLDKKGVCVSAGSACRAHEQLPSSTLLAMGVSEEDARNSVRFSFSRMNYSDEVVEAAEIVSNCVNVLSGF